MTVVDLNDPSARRPLDPRAIDAASVFLKDTVIAMGLDADVNVREEGGDTVLELSGPDAKHLVGKKGVTLDALQLLANRVATKTVAGDRASLVVDADGYRAKRERTLTTMAQELGERCVKEGKVILMEPLPPRERRTVHMALAKFEGVQTQSEGEGEERRIKIIPMPPP
jgi:spoIIIJ-associated protein